MFVNFFRFLKFAAKDFYRNFWLSVVTIVILILSLLAINFLIVLNVLAKKSVDLVKEKVDISVYFKPEVSERLVKDAEKQISAWPQIKSVQRVTKEEAMKRFQQKHESNPLIVESLNELGQNPLGDTLIIKTNNVDDYSVISTNLDNADFADAIQNKNFNDYQQIIVKLNQAAYKIRQIGSLVILIFAFIAALMVFNTIRVIIYTRKEEIGIMRLVGATKKFIFMPFLLEGVFYALSGWIITLGFIYPLLNFIQPYLNGFFGDYSFNIHSYFNQYFFQIFGLELLAIILLNIVSSGLAVRKYSKV